MTKKANQKTQPAVTPTPALAAVTEPAATPTRNIKFIGRPVFAPGKKKILEDPQPIERFSDRGEQITLPPADFQIRARLFYHEKAAQIAAVYPFLYKQIIPKG